MRARGWRGGEQQGLRWEMGKALLINSQKTWGLCWLYTVDLLAGRTLSISVLRCRTTQQLGEKNPDTHRLKLQQIKFCFLSNHTDEIVCDYILHIPQYHPLSKLRFYLTQATTSCGHLHSRSWLHFQMVKTGTTECKILHIMLEIIKNNTCYIKLWESKS